MIVGLIGNLGEGKTVGMVFLIKLLLDETDINRVSSNFQLEYSDNYINNPQELDKRSKENKEEDRTEIYGLDEIWSWMNARESFDNDKMIDVVINIRKRSGIALYTTQNLFQVDRILRNNTDFICVCRHYEADKFGLEKDMAEIYIFDNDLNLVNRLRYCPEPLYGVYDTDEEIAGSSEKEEYEDLIKDKIAEVEAGEWTNKKDLHSELVVAEDINPTKADRLTTYIFNQVDD